jgi:hypothetical protein
MRFVTRDLWFVNGVDAFFSAVNFSVLSVSSVLNALELSGAGTSYRQLMGAVLEVASLRR